MIAASGGAVWGLYKLFALLRGPYFRAFINPYNRDWALLCFALVAVFISSLVFFPLRKWVSKIPFQLGIWLIWLAGAYAAALLAPGFHFMLAIPLFMFMCINLFRFILTRSISEGDWKEIVLLLAASFWLVVVYSQAIALTSISLGLSLSFIPAVFVVLIFSQLHPLFSIMAPKKSWIFIVCLFILILTTAAITLKTAQFTKEEPQPYALNYMQGNEEDYGIVYAYRRLNHPWMKSFLPDTTSRFQHLGLNNVYAIQTPKTSLAVPIWRLELDQTENGLRHIKGKIFSEQCLTYMVLDSANVISFDMEGHTYKGESQDMYLSHCGPQGDGIDVKIILSPCENFGFSLIGLDYGLPAEIREIIPDQPQTLMPSYVYTRVMNRIKLAD
jgi:hypothetical protein